MAACRKNSSGTGDPVPTYVPTTTPSMRVTAAAQSRSFSLDRSLKSVVGPLGDPPREGDEAAAGAPGMMAAGCGYVRVGAVDRRAPLVAG